VERPDPNSKAVRGAGKTAARLSKKAQLKGGKIHSGTAALGAVA
jgi:hypothetical protein